MTNFYLRSRPRHPAPNFKFSFSFFQDRTEKNSAFIEELKQLSADTEFSEKVVELQNQVTELEEEKGQLQLRVCELEDAPGTNKIF